MPVGQPGVTAGLGRESAVSLQQDRGRPPDHANFQISGKSIDAACAGLGVAAPG
jgi:hypothetical protein